MCYCAQCEPLGGRLMSENDLIVHQRALQEARLRANEVTPDTRTRLHINKTNQTPIIQRSAPMEASQRQTLTVVSGSRTDIRKKSTMFGELHRPL